MHCHWVVENAWTGCGCLVCHSECFCLICALWFVLSLLSLSRDVLASYLWWKKSQCVYDCLMVEMLDSLGNLGPIPWLMPARLEYKSDERCISTTIAIPTTSHPPHHPHQKPLPQLANRSDHSVYRVHYQRRGRSYQCPHMGEECHY